MFFASASSVRAEVAKLEGQAGAGIDEEPFFDDLTEAQLAAVAPEYADGFLNIGCDFAVVVGDEDAEGRAGQGFEVFLDDLGHE